MGEYKRVIVCKAYKCRGCMGVFSEREHAEDCDCGLWSYRELTVASELEKKVSKDIANLEGLGFAEDPLPPMSDEFILGTRKTHLLGFTEDDPERERIQNLTDEQWIAHYKKEIQPIIDAEWS